MLCNFYLMEKLHTLADAKESTAFTPDTVTPGGEMRMYLCIGNG